jgi:malonyl-CoA O-methyltransferase
MDIKEKIATIFSASATHYDQYAVIQQLAALSMVRCLTDIRHQLPVGPVIEIGCGTGAVSRELLTMFPGRKLTLVDLAPGMIAANRQALAPLLETSHHVDWQVRDAETTNVDNHYALIVSCMALQWFQDLKAGLSRLCKALVPDGFLLCSYLGDKSFPEWQSACSLLDLPCTMNRLPDSQELMETLHALDYKVTAWSEMIEQHYPTAQDFFRSLKKTGTNTQSASDRLPLAQMKHLLSSWPKDKNGVVTITYQINSILVRA